MQNHDHEVISIPNLSASSSHSYNIKKSPLVSKKIKQVLSPKSSLKQSKKMKVQSIPSDKTVTLDDKLIDSLILENLLEEKDHGETLAYINFYDKNKKLLEELEKNAIFTKLVYMKLLAQKINIYKCEFLVFLRDVFLKNCLVPTYNTCRIQPEDHKKFIFDMRNAILNLMNSNINALGEIYEVKINVADPDDKAIAIASIIDHCLNDLHFTRLPKELQKILNCSFAIGLDGYNQILQKIKEKKTTLHKISLEQIPSCFKISDLIKKFEEAATDPNEYTLFKNCIKIINLLKSPDEEDIFIRDAKIESYLQKLSQNAEDKDIILREINLQMAILINQLLPQPQKEIHKFSISELVSAFVRMRDQRQIEDFHKYYKTLKNKNLKGYSFTDANLLNTFYLYRIVGGECLASEILAKCIKILEIHTTEALFKKETIETSNFSGPSNFFSMKPDLLSQPDVPKIQQVEQPASICGRDR